MSVNNEQYGVAVEEFLSSIFNVPFELDEQRSNRNLYTKLIEHSSKVVLDEFEHLGISIEKYCGEKQNKHDFMLNDGLTLSAKTNIGKLGKVCPQEIGQMSSNRFYERFLANEIVPSDYEVRKEVFKEYILKNSAEMLIQYYKHLFNSDYLFYMYNLDELKPNFFLLEKIKIPDFKKELIRVKKNREEWKSSNIIYYDDKILGEFQLHNNRDCFKFRFYMPTLLSLFPYETDTVTLRNEDCLEYLKRIPDNSVDLVLLDPPYKISRKTNFAQGEKTGRDVDRLRVTYEFGAWDKGKDVLEKVIQESYRVLKKSGTIVCFYDLWKISYLKKWLEKSGFKQVRFCEWLKTNPVPINSKKNYLTNAREAIVTAFKVGPPTFNSEYDNGVYRYPINHEKGRFHPTQKPTKLIEELILKHSNENELVLDCFSGSGTTAVSCVNTKRRFTGTELDPLYFKKSVNRISNKI